MVVGLVDSSNQCLPTLLLLSSIKALNSSSKLWVWLNNSRGWGPLQGHRVWELRQWVNLDLEQGSQGNLEARLVWVSSFPTR